MDGVSIDFGVFVIILGVLRDCKGYVDLVVGVLLRFCWLLDKGCWNCCVIGDE